MTKTLEDAIEKVRRLPEERQAYVAEVLEQIAAAGSDLFTAGPPIDAPAVETKMPSAHRAPGMTASMRAPRNARR